MNGRKKRKSRNTGRGAVIVSIAAVFLTTAAVLFYRYGGYWKRSSRPQTIKTAAVPEEYHALSEHAGTVVRMDYPATDYTNGKPVTKPAYVYLPYGYSEDGQYDVLYLIHGWMMRAQDYLSDEAEIKTLFDQMIARGEVKPFIAVSLTFDAENEPQTYERSVEELAQFHFELRNDAIPYLEDRLAVYAEHTSLKGLRASRSHRAFAGFSMGAVTTWHQFIFNLDLIRSFIPMSGDSWITGANGGLLRPEKTVRRITDTINDGWYKQDDYFLYVCTGTGDPMYEQTDTQVKEMFRRQEFSAENMIYALKEGGYHDMTAVREYLYNALPVIFPGEESSGN